ncbi:MULTISPECIES: hypothetical protein [Actinomadura]|uniref:hypothetical protein n=1 Tax=Actinomadura TaxID=1988 RepID=UPI00146EF042|nr:MULTISPECIES: hypothetical protein [Actinomadura]
MLFESFGKEVALVHDRLSSSPAGAGTHDVDEPHAADVTHAAGHIRRDPFVMAAINDERSKR